MKKRVLSTILCLCLLLSLLPTAVFASGQPWEGYTAISDQAGLEAIAEDLSGKYYLTKDIALSGDWLALGWTDDADVPFTGILDGNGHTISGLICSYDGATNVGLFAINEGIIQNLNLDIVRVGGSQFVGSVAGVNKNTIQNVIVTQSPYSSAVGVAALNTGSSGGYAGGIAGQNRGTIYQCGTNIGTVNAYNYAGGIAGGNWGTVEQCYAKGGLNARFYTTQPSYATYYVGGLVGGNVGTVKDCYVNLDNWVIGTQRLGGFVGWQSDKGKIEHCYAAHNDKVNSKTGPSTPVRDVSVFIGLNAGSVSDTWVSGTGGSAIGAQYITYANLADQAYVGQHTGLDFDGVWAYEQGKNHDYPIFAWETQPAPAPEITDIQKERLTAMPGGAVLNLPDGITVEYGPVSFPADAPDTAEVTLLYQITVTGTGGAAFALTDEGAVLVGSDCGAVQAADGVITGTIADTASAAVLYVIKTFTKADAANGRLTNSASVAGEAPTTGEDSSGDVDIDVGVTAPAAPTDDALSRLAEDWVSVDCTTAGADHDTAHYPLLDGSYALGGVSGDAESGWTCDVTIQAAPYVQQYCNDVPGVTHTLNEGAPERQTVALRYTSAGWTLAEDSSLPVTFAVSCPTTPVEQTGRVVLRIFRNGTTADRSLGDVVVGTFPVGGDMREIAAGIDLDMYYAPAKGAFGYEFDGVWYKDNAAPVWRLDQTSTVLKSDWNRIMCVVYDQYRVNYHVDDLAVPSGVMTEKSRADYVLFQPEAREGYTFDGWYEKKAEIGTAGKNVHTPLALKKYELYGAYAANSYDVAFDAGSGSSATVGKKVTYDAAYGELPVPTPPVGYTFAGWYLGDGEITAQTIVKTAGNHTLTARYDIIMENVVYFQSDGDYAAGKALHGTKAAYGSQLPTADAPAPTREGYTFRFWSREGQAGIDVAGQTVSGWTNLIADWGANSYTVTLDAGKGTCAASGKEVLYDAAYGELPVPTPPRGYTFAGWYLGDTEVTAETVVKTARDHTLTARYESTIQHVHYFLTDADRAEGNVLLATTASFDSRLPTDDAPPPTREGYTFRFWSREGQAGIDVAGQTVSGWTNLIANWDANSYTAIYHGNGGTLASDPDKEQSASHFTYGSEVTLKNDRTFTRDGYTFLGWAAAPDAAAAEYQGGQKVVFPFSGITDGKVHLYAVWEKNETVIHVSFNLFEGSWGDETADTDPKQFDLYSTSADASMTVPTVVAPEGKVLSHWVNNLGIAGLTLRAGDSFSFASLETAGVADFDAREAYIGFTPVFEDVPVEKTLRIYWGIDNHEHARWDDHADTPAWTQIVPWENRADAMAFPALSVDEGYLLDGWNVSGAQPARWDPDAAEFSLADLVLEDENGGFVSITANIVSAEIPVEKTLRIYWGIDNYEHARWDDHADTPAWTQIVPWENRADAMAFPALSVDEGYLLDGWNVSGAQPARWDPDAAEFSLADLVLEDENGGFVSITANIVSAEIPVEKTLRIYWGIDNYEHARWDDHADTPAWTQIVPWENRADAMAFPALSVDEGYLLDGWNVSGAQPARWDPDAAEFSLADLFVEDENGGFVSITANIKTAQHTVTFDSQGGSAVEPQAVAHGTAVTQPAAPERSGYVFGGWYQEETFQTAWNFAEDTVTADLVLYARWAWSGGGVTTYAITASAGDGGSISPSGRVSVARGRDKTFTVRPGDGYAVKDVLVDGESIGAVESYTFENVRTGHTIKAIFEAKFSAADPGDTGVSKWLNTEEHSSYLRGYANGAFGPNDKMTRAEAAQMFYNLLLDKDIAVTVSFSDVPADAWYAGAVNALASIEVITGVGNSRFDPMRPLTRAEFTVMAMRFSKLDTDGENVFSDITEGDWFFDYIVGSVKYGWISGYTDGTFRPNEAITRAEVTVIVNRMLGRAADEDYVDDHAGSMHPFSDLTDSSWAYYQIMEATNAHDYTKSSGAETWTKLRQ